MKHAEIFRVVAGRSPDSRVVIRLSPSHAYAQWPLTNVKLDYRCGGSDGVAIAHHLPDYHHTFSCTTHLLQRGTIGMLMNDVKPHQAADSGHSKGHQLE